MISWFEKNHWISWIFVFIIASVIFYVSSLNAKSLGAKGTNLNALIYHISIFFILAFFLLIAIVKGRHKYLSLIAINIAIVYAISDEIHQFFVIGRYLSPRDIFLDSLGILLASAIYLVSLEYRKNHK